MFPRLLSNVSLIIPVIANRHDKISHCTTTSAQRSLRGPSLAWRTELIRASKSVDAGVANGLIACYETSLAKVIAGCRGYADVDAMFNTLARSGLQLPVDSTRGCPVSKSFVRPASVRPVKDRCLRNPKQVLQGYCPSNSVRPVVA